MALHVREHVVGRDHQALCPSFGGTPPPFPDVVPGPDVPLPHQRAAVLAEASRAVDPSC